MATRSAGFASRYRVRKDDSGSLCVRLRPPRPAIRNLRPADGIASKTVTLAPLCANTSAAINPAGPAPMTATSIFAADMSSAQTSNRSSCPDLIRASTSFLLWPSWVAGSSPAMTAKIGAPSAQTGLQLHTRPRRGLADILVGLLEGVFQRPGGRHVGDLREMRRN